MKSIYIAIIIISATLITLQVGFSLGFASGQKSAPTKLYVCADIGNCINTIYGKELGDVQIIPIGNFVFPPKLATSTIMTDTHCESKYCYLPQATNTEGSEVCTGSFVDEVLCGRYLRRTGYSCFNLPPPTCTENGISCAWQNLNAPNFGNCLTAQEEYEKDYPPQGEISATHTENGVKWTGDRCLMGAKDCPPKEWKGVHCESEPHYEGQTVPTYCYPTTEIKN